MLASTALTAAALSVSGNGQAGTAYPIAVPPGIAGMEPQLSLGYSDGGVNGPVGVGWSVQGISMITRCPATRPQDGHNRSVEFGPADKLCLDGQRLIQTGADGEPLTTQTNDALGLASGAREYRTEKDGYARIRAYGIAGASADNGPAFFKVWTKSGQIHEYGRDPANTANVNALIPVQDSSRIAVWAVRRIADTADNDIRFRYDQRSVNWGSGTAGTGAPGREWVLREVAYTGRASQLPPNKVEFVYGERPTSAAPGFDRAEAYQWSHKNVSVWRLDEIRTYVNSPNPDSWGPASTAVRVRTLKLAYERSPATGRSRLSSITECAGAAADLCLPPTSYTYSNPAAVSFTANANFAAGPVKNLNMLDAGAGHYGILTGDFDGDGRTDILRWSSDPAHNQLWRSLGNGQFENLGSFDLKQSAHVLFKPDGCHHSIVADFNGDGLSDILRTVAKTGCNPSTNVLYRSNGNGSFTAVALPPALDLRQSVPYETVTPATCMILQSLPAAQAQEIPTDAQDSAGPAHGLAAGSPAAPAMPISISSLCHNHYRSEGRRYYIIDVDGDGLPDILSTVLPSYSWNTGWGPAPGPQQLCSGMGWPPHSGPCTRLFKGVAGGGFVEASTNIASTTVYSPHTGSRFIANPYWRLPDQADIDGDGLQDILSTSTGRWRSLGNGNFVPSSAQDTSQLCGLPIDFNGDGRTDCLRAEAQAGSQQLTLSYGNASSGALAQFDLKTAGHHLYGTDSQNHQNVGAVIEDFDGDGRQDILRWGPSPAADNGIYFSRGDGSFGSRQAAGLTALPVALQSGDGTARFVLGDFLGNGTVQILHLKSNPPGTGGTVANTNQLYARSGAAGPVDVLASVTSPTGLTGTVDQRLPLTHGGHYVNDRGTGEAATGALVDLQPPLYVITSVSRQTGAGTLTTRYLYKGLKAERGGRGLLGFREVQQEDTTPAGGTLNVVTEYLLNHPYNGVARRTRTFLAALGNSAGTPLSTTTNLYCDRMALHTQDAPSPAPTEAGPCPSPKRVARPYLRQSIEEGRDLSGAVLPKVTTTNTYNDFGDPTKIEVKTEANFAGGNRTYTTLTENTFCAPDSSDCPNKTSGDHWILGRLERAKVTNTVHDLLNTLSAGAGNSPTATAITGSPPPGSTQAINPAVLSAILQLLLED